MKHLLTIVFIGLVGFGYGQNRYSENEITSIYDPVVYLKINNSPVSGIVYVLNTEGELYKEINYKNGKRDGLYKKYNKDGTVILKENYQEGILVKDNRPKLFISEENNFKVNFIGHPKILEESLLGFSYKLFSSEGCVVAINKYESIDFFDGTEHFLIVRAKSSCKSAGIEFKLIEMIVQNGYPGIHYKGDNGVDVFAELKLFNDQDKDYIIGIYSKSPIDNKKSSNFLNSFEFLDFNPNIIVSDDDIIQEMIENCIKDFPILNITEENKKEYCKCKMQNFYDFDITEFISVKNKDSVFNDQYMIDQYKKRNKMLQVGEHGEVYNKIIFPCIDLLQLSLNEYNSIDIIGSKPESIIPLIGGTIKKLKIEIGGIVRYFTFDTGADELVINSELEKELLEKKLINSNNYVEEKEFQIADGSIVSAKGVRLNNVVIGDYKVNNVVAYIVDEGGMLCGMGFMNKFKDWNLDVKNKTLTIYK